ncbi:YidB family protein [Paucibacter sp. AS339]|uniref:YidB family protein n=1 Tax=Paucibacter hankyongi TaxID=3133434 RepID=UPI0030AFBD26
MSLMDSLLGLAQQALVGQGGAVGGGGADWVGIVSGLLANGSAHGGMGGLLEKLAGAGLGEQVKSWVSTGANLPVSGEQLSAALGGNLMDQLTAQSGASHADVGAILSQMLPQIIDKLTPHGEVPAAGAGNIGDLSSLLGGLLKA